MLVLSWNISNDDADPVRLARCLSEHQPDVVVLQEALPTHIELLQSTYQNVAVANDSVRAGALCFLVIATDAPSAETQKSVHFETKKDDLTWGARLFSWVEFLDTHYVDITTSTGQLLRIINVHLSAAASPAKRRKELEMAWQHVPIHGPCIIAGDFNSFSGPLISLCVALPFGYRISDLFPDEGQELEAYLNAYRFKSATHRMTHSWLRRQLDHVFVRDIELSSADTISERYGSDHNPIIVGIKESTGVAAQTEPQVSPLHPYSASTQ